MISKELIEETMSLISKLHDNIIKQTGGEFGILSQGNLYYSTYKLLTYKENNITGASNVGAFTLIELSRKQIFLDGNKRTSYIFMKFLLLKLGFSFRLPYNQAVNFILKVAEHNSKITFKQTEEWVKINTFNVTKEELEIYLKEFDL